MVSGSPASLAHSDVSIETNQPDRSDPSEPAGSPHLLSIALEDYFDARPFHQLISERHRRRLESRISAQTDRVLAILDRIGARATFFSLGRLAEPHADVLRRIVAAGHEVGARDWEPASILPRIDGRDDQAESERLRSTGLRSRLALSDAIGEPVAGFRVARGRLATRGLGALEALASAGFAYDSSFYPTPRDGRTRPLARFPFVYESEVGPLVEMPVSTWGPRRLTVPLGGGTLFRQMPGRPVDWMVRDYATRYTSPLNLYFHVWEFDPQLPRLGVGSRLTRLRRYRKLSCVEPMLERLAAAHRFVSIRDYLQNEAPEREREAYARALRLRSHRTCDVGGSPEKPAEQADSNPTVALAPSAAGRTPATPPSGRVDLEALTPEPLTLVVPCYAESAILGYTAEALAELEAALLPRPLRLIFVDDASPDNTAEELERRFGHRPGCRVLRHETNRGVAAAILTGIRAADTDLVGSMDCDCTYDPMIFARITPRMEAERRADPSVAMLTASPYHPDGEVLNVPAWRLGLSRGLSTAYRFLLRADVFTFTACVRLHHRPSLEALEIHHGGFLGVAEMLVELDRRGHRIVEEPARLESRLLGTSKMKTLRTIRAHLGLLARIALLRVRGRYDLPPASGGDSGGAGTLGPSTSPATTGSVASQPVSSARAARPHQPDRSGGLRALPGSATA